MLAKDPERRFRLIHEVKTDLERLQRAGETSGGQLSTSEESFRRLEARWKRILPWAAASLFAVVASLALWAPWEKAPEREVSRRLSVELGIDLSLPDGGLGEGTAAVLSPDGSLLAFVGKSADGERQLYLRRMDHLEPTPISGTEGAPTQEVRRRAACLTWKAIVLNDSGNFGWISTEWCSKRSP